MLNYTLFCSSVRLWNDSGSPSRFYFGSRVKDRSGSAANNKEMLRDLPGNNNAADFYINSGLYIAFGIGLCGMNCNLQSQD